jgi:hypothetical protein
MDPSAMVTRQYGDAPGNAELLLEATGDATRALRHSARA